MITCVLVRTSSDLVANGHLAMDRLLGGDVDGGEEAGVDEVADEDQNNEEQRSRNDQVRRK